MEAGIRKAAILVSLLDTETGESILRYMGTAVAQAVYRALPELGEVDVEERRQVLEDFLTSCPLAPEQRQRMLDGLNHDKLIDQPRQRNETDRQLAGNLRAGVSALSESNPEKRHSVIPNIHENKPQRFEFLKDACADNLAGLLTTERPQTIALVLAHLPPDQAGQVMVRFDSALQVEVVRRLIALEEADTVIVEEVEQALEARISKILPKERRRVAGLSAISGILEASDKHVGLQLLASLHMHDRSLADKLSLKRVTFEELIEMDDQTISTVLGEADPQIAILALVGAPTEFLDRLLSRLPEHEARIVEHQLNHLAPTRLRDVEEARDRIVDLAYELAARDVIRVPQLMPTLKKEPAATMEFAA